MTEIVQPDGWKRPSGYSNAIRANGEMIFVTAGGEKRKSGASSNWRIINAIRILLKVGTRI